MSSRNSEMSKEQQGGRMRSTYIVAGCVALLLLAVNSARTQGVGSSGTIKGTVTDPSGAFITKAEVSVVDTEKGAKRTTTTDDAGEYVLTGLAPATYDITVRASTFAERNEKVV